MPKRPWRCYRELTKRAYVKKQKKTKKMRRLYVKGVPDPKIRIFTMGKRNPEFDYVVKLTINEIGNINNLSLEAARIASNRYLRKNLGTSNYYLKILLYPFHVIREHKMMTFAGADRLQDGMRRAFGKPCGTAVRIRKIPKDIMLVKVKKQNLEIAKEALRRAKHKFPLKSSISILTSEEYKQAGGVF
ncbi:MAG: 50S ribosomal protein L16 [Candidatus Helarchaeota archaeon]